MKKRTNWKLFNIVYSYFFSHFYRETDVKGLIKNIKKDHMFLRKYMNDVKDYVDIIEMTMPKKCNYKETIN